eukprot:c6744_g1_i1 orf=361-780(+)
MYIALCTFMAVYKPLWAPEELIRRGLQPLARSKPCVVVETNAQEIHHTSQQGDVQDVASLFFRYGNHYTFQDDVSLVAQLKACAKEKDLLTGSRLHADILKWGLLAKSTFIGSTLVNLYAKCGVLVKAQELLDELPVRD